MAVSVATALLLAALFAGDSVWTALAALLVAGGWGALALAGRAPLPGGGARAARRCCSRRGLGRALDRVVGGARPLVGRARPDARVRGVPRPSGSCSARRARARAAGRRSARRGARGRGRLGARGQGDPRALPRRRPDGAAARPDRLLERARARRRHAARARARSSRRLGPVARSPWRRRGARLRGRRRGPPRCVSRRRRGCGARRRALALAPPRPRRGRAARARRRAAGRRGRGVGVHAARRSSRTGSPRADRVADGAWFGVLLLAGAVVVAWLVARARDDGRCLRLRRRTVGRGAGRARGRRDVVVAVAARRERGPDRRRVPRRAR